MKEVVKVVKGWRAYTNGEVENEKQMKSTRLWMADPCTLCLVVFILKAFGPNLALNAFTILCFLHVLHLSDESTRHHTRRPIYASFKREPMH